MRLKTVNICVSLLIMTCNLLKAQQAVRSDDFVDAAGVNVHLHYTETPYYTNWSLIKQALIDLGVRHVRDGLIDTTLQAYYNRHIELSEVGITGIYTIEASQSTWLLQAWPSRVKGAFAGYESPNELDGVAGGLSTLRGTVPRLFLAANGGTAPNVPVIGPSLVEQASYALLGNVSPYFDYGNVHNYYSGRNPGNTGWGGTDSEGHRYGSLAYTLDSARLVSGSKPVWSTETGYNNDPFTTNYISQAAAAIYMPRLLLEHWNAGIRRTYIYELLSEGLRPNSDFGLLTTTGGRKPAFYAVSNLLNMLTDKDDASFTPQSLAYTINGGNSNLHRLLLQKTDGTFYLALWVELPSYDPDRHYSYAVASQPVVLHTPRSFSAVTIHQWDSSGDVTDTKLSGGDSFSLVITDKLMVVQLTPTPDEWSLNLSRAPETGGTVDVSPKSSDMRYSVGTTVRLTAKPAAGCTFEGFRGAFATNSSVLTVNPKSSMTTQAEFRCK
jgi:hypothetical protein